MASVFILYVVQKIGFTKVVYCLKMCRASFRGLVRASVVLLLLIVESWKVRGWGGSQWHNALAKFRTTWLAGSEIKLRNIEIRVLY
jgi:hypothetical protein